MSNNKKNIKALLFGVGFDNKDGHIRITHGENYRIYGGSENTHNYIFEKVTKFNEQLDKKGKKLESISENEFIDIANKVGMNITDPTRN